MADINQVITLGIGTPSGVPEFLTLGLQIGDAVVIDTPADRIYAISGDNRVYSIEGENRVYSIKGESRVYPIPGEE